MNITDKEKKEMGIKHVVTVTTETTYWVPDYDTSNINELMDEWFVKTPLGAGHVYRDNRKVGFSEKVLKVEIDRDEN